MLVQFLQFLEGALQRCQVCSHLIGQGQAQNFIMLGSGDHKNQCPKFPTLGHTTDLIINLTTHMPKADLQD